MNELIKQLQNRRSVREFTGEKLKEEDLQTILETAQRAANSVNGQQTSLIVIRDKEKLAKIAELCGGQKHIAQAEAFIFVLIDFHRGVYASNSLGKRNIAPKSADGILVGAVDAGIMVNALQTAAFALGYGGTVIGAIRKIYKNARTSKIRISNRRNNNRSPCRKKPNKSKTKSPTRYIRI